MKAQVTDLDLARCAAVPPGSGVFLRLFLRVEPVEFGVGGTVGAMIASKARAAWARMPGST